MNFLKVLRNNWKKSVFGVGAGSYGCHYGYETYQISCLMKSNSKEAALYGEQLDQSKKLIVILNPAANKKKSEKAFRKYCEPILHLAGFAVEIIKTDSEGYAKTYMEQLRSLPNAVVIAGGDGTVSEVLTGMMRSHVDRCPIAILPLGEKNEVAKKFLNQPWSTKVHEVEALIKASLSIARGNLQQKSVFKIEQISTENSESKPIYSMGYLQWGIYRDIKSKLGKFWYLGKGDSYLTPLLAAFNSSLSWKCQANVCYSLPCVGCSNCSVAGVDTSQGRSFLSKLFIRTQAHNAPLKGISSECSQQHEEAIDSSNVSIYLDESSEPNRLVLEKEAVVEPGFSFYLKYVKEVLGNTQKPKEQIMFRKMTLIPEESSMGLSNFYSIDNEIYDVRSVGVTLIPKAIQMYI